MMAKTVRFFVLKNLKRLIYIVFLPLLEAIFYICKPVILIKIQFLRKPSTSINFVGELFPVSLELDL